MRVGERRFLGLDSMHNCAYNIQVEFQWDSKKALSNLKKHGIDFNEKRLRF
jgi:hypothetical protein